MNNSIAGGLGIENVARVYEKLPTVCGFLGADGDLVWYRASTSLNEVAFQRTTGTADPLISAFEHCFPEIRLAASRIDQSDNEGS
jgi:hypothetical protein